MGVDGSVGDMIASPQAITFGRENIQGVWYIVMKIHGHGALKFSPNIAHGVARELVGQANAVEKLDGSVIISPRNKFPFRR